MVHKFEFSDKIHLMWSLGSVVLPVVIFVWLICSIGLNLPENIPTKVDNHAVFKLKTSIDIYSRCL